MHTTTSADGTSIAYERAGSGEPIVFVAGAFNDRTTLAPLAKELEDRFTVITYDRRGRGDSGDTAPYAVEREIEDLDAVIAAAGGSAYVFGFSSGAVIALKAAARGSAITGLALYEPPLEPGAGPVGADFPNRIAALVRDGRRGDAVELFQREAVGLPPEMIAGIRQMPFWPALEAAAHTLVYDTTITGPAAPTPQDLARVTVPVVVMNGASTIGDAEKWAIATAAALPNGRHQRMSAGENHTIDPAAAAPVVAEAFAAA